MRIQTFDTTLRDGTQGEAVSFSVDDKLLVAKRLDELGIDYIEGGWPGSNPKDEEFFQRARDLHLGHAKLTAFGSTRLARNPVDQDASVLALVAAGTPAVAIFGKTWDLHVSRALGITLEENLTLIAETVAFLKAHGKEVIYDAEHFFDGYAANPDYAMRTLEAAHRAGADVLCLCDTNGGTLTAALREAVIHVRSRFDGVIGIHTHNDSGVAVANALAAIDVGATHVQGCLNGYGERCGNANLASVIADLELKVGHETIGPEKLGTLASACKFVAELANLPLRNDQPFVGKSAFAHKGGVHVSAVLKDTKTYEHVAPEIVGNQRRVLVSDLSGRGNITYQLAQHGLADRLDDAGRRELLARIKQMEHDGYEFEAADGTFELLVRETLSPGLHFFDVDSYEVFNAVGRRRRHADDGEGPDPGARRPPLGDDRRARAVQRAPPVLAPVPGRALSADWRRAAHRLQGSRARLARRHGVQGPRPHRVGRSARDVVHRRRVRQHHRGQLESAGRCRAPRAHAPGGRASPRRRACARSRRSARRTLKRVRG